MTYRPSSFRITPITETDEELSALLEKTLLIDGKPANIFGVLAKHPALLKRFNLLGWPAHPNWTKMWTQRRRNCGSAAPDWLKRLG
jgi:hypothetical protein